jgi:hypothetical protein
VIVWDSSSDEGQAVAAAKGPLSKWKKYVVV